MNPTKKLIIAYAMRPTPARLLAAKVGLTRRSVTRHITELRQLGLMYIGAWGKVGNQSVAMYAAGHGTDARKPAPEPRRVYDARYRAKNPHKSLVVEATPWDALLRPMGKRKEKL